MKRTILLRTISFVLYIALLFIAIQFERLLGFVGITYWICIFLYMKHSPLWFIAVLSIGADAFLFRPVGLTGICVWAGLFLFLIGKKYRLPLLVRLLGLFSVGIVLSLVNLQGGVFPWIAILIGVLGCSILSMRYVRLYTVSERVV